MINLGTANGWKNTPTAYQTHLDNCGVEYTYKHCLGKPGNFEMRTRRKYDLTVTKLGRCYRKEHCNECGCEVRIDSSD